MKKTLFPMNLQLFADPVPPSDPTPPAAEINIEELSEEQLAAVKEKFGLKNNDEVDSIIKGKRSRWQKELEEKELEAEKLAKMNADEKAAHENQKLKEKIAEYERQENLSKMASEASKMLKEAELPIDLEMIELIVHEDSEKTSKVIKSVISYVNDVIEKEHIKKNTGKTPEVMTKGSKKESSLNTTEQLNQNRII